VTERGGREVFEELRELMTEQRNPRTMDLDSKSIREILEIINREDERVARAVAEEIPNIERAVEVIVEALGHGGRLIYVGAGTSGRLGVLDAAECPPTFGTSLDMIQGVIAGGYGALVRAQEGAEDRAEEGEAELIARGVGERDIVVGIAASRRTPFVLGALAKARELGARTVYLCSNPSPTADIEADIVIAPLVGPEVIMGSTRMKAATAQKMVLNMLTTTSMVRLGKVYENMMVDLQATSQKLTERSKRVLMIVTGVSYDDAARMLDLAGGSVKTAIIMIKKNLGRSEAEALLREADGFVGKALARAGEMQ